MRTKMIVIFAASLCLGACVPGSGLRFTLDTPPLALVPVSYAGVADERRAFRDTFCSVMEDHGAALEHARPCEDALHELRGGAIPGQEAMVGPFNRSLADIRLVIAPGIFGECVARYALPFSDSVEHLKNEHQLGEVQWVPLSGRSSSEQNARELADWLQQNPGEPGKRLVLLGYSKGASDILEALRLYPEAFPAGSSVVSVAGVMSGTPVADRAANLYSAFAKLPLPDCDAGDGEEVTSLTRRHRLSWLASEPLPAGVRYYSLVSFAPRSRISRALKPFYKSLSSHDARNDGQVIFQDAVIPGGTLLGYANADHWAVALPLREHLPIAAPLLNHNDYPRTVLLEAILKTIGADLQS